MTRLRVHLLGTGDAFGSGGRFQSCTFVDDGAFRFLLDCGASSLVAMKRFAVDPGEVDAVVCTHLHGDHLGGIPFLIRETQIARQRSRPLLIAGPSPIEARTSTAMEVFFPGSSAPAATTFPVRYLELTAGRPTIVGPLTVHAYPAIHSPGTNPHLLRIEGDGWVLAASGDTAWTDDLLRAAEGADLLLCECYRETPGSGHLDYQTLMARRAELGARRVVLTHLGEAMLARRGELAFEVGEDGAVLEL